jgi:hypothetical protein
LTDSEEITNAVDISASSLFEAAVLAMAEFRRHGFAEHHVWTGHKPERPA